MKAGLCLALMLAVSRPLFCQETKDPPDQAPIGTITRLGALFSDLEVRALKAIQKRDRAGLERLLSDEFQVWAPTPGGPLAREDWLPSNFGGYTLRSYQIRQVAVRGFADTAVVSFVERLQADASGKDKSGDFFVVDVWVKRVGGRSEWQLSDRYISPVVGVAPGGPAKPTGKE